MVSERPGLPEGLSLGAAIRFLRRRDGMSQYELTRRLGFSARSNLSDYERDRRVPPPDVVRACEQIFGLCDGELRRLRSQTLDERARESAREASGPSGTAAAGPVAAGPGSPEPVSRFPRRRIQVALAVAVAAAAAVTLTAVATDMASGGQHPRTLRHAPVDTPAPISGTTHDFTHRDGDDPIVTGCSQDGATQDQVSVRLPGGAYFGRLALRHSAFCEMSWGAVVVSARKPGRVWIIAWRPSDQVTAPSSVAAIIPPASWGNMLSTRVSCVQVSAYVQTPKGRGPMATTSCLR